MSSMLVQIPVIQKLKKPKESSEEFEEVTRIVMELVSPSYIVRISPISEDRTIIWLSHNVPHIEVALSYEDVIKTLTKANQIEQNNGS